ncbi:MAG: hypothetical protein K9G60_16635 [Pseudolabrys sp.]|nr:hypothetical protein [Pseudolabrys sp.]
MLGLPTRSRADDTAVSLEACAEGAGAALACCYSSSAEFDAALIAERRAAGVYGPKRQRKQMLATLAGVVAGLMVVFVAIALIA